MDIETVKLALEYVSELGGIYETIEYYSNSFGAQERRDSLTALSKYLYRLWIV